MENTPPLTPQPVLDSQVQPPSAASSLTLKIVIIVLVVLIPITGGLGYYLGTNTVKSEDIPDNWLGAASPSPVVEENIACTLEAKVCPDGSSVGRTGPNCEFAPCPEVETNSNTRFREGWRNYSDETYSFQYPEGKWNIQPGSTASEEYMQGDVVTILAPAPTVSIEISPQGAIYGFGGGETKYWEGELISVTVNGQVFTGKEMFREEEGVTKVFVDMPVKIGTREYHILFGTGYPVNTDATASYENYQRFKPTMLEILSTLTIHPG